MELQELFTSNSSIARNFRSNIRQYNNALAFASMGAYISEFVGGPYCFKVSGEVYHRTARDLSISKPDNEYAQLYIYDPDVAALERMRNPANKKCISEVMLLLSRTIHGVSPYAHIYKTLKDAYDSEKSRVRETGGPMLEIQLIFAKSEKGHPRKYNPPKSTAELGIVYVAGRDGQIPGEIDFAVHLKDETRPQSLSILSPHVDPMTFPLFFPCGEPGWSINLAHEGPSRTSVRNTVTHLQFYSYKIAVRPNIFNPLHYGGKLFQQYMVHAYIMCEASRLKYIRNHQQELRVESYQGLHDYVHEFADTNSCRVGSIVILPATFQGGPRHMHKLYQDSMAVVHAFGKPDLFITFTCNPKWPEISENLNKGQAATDRPDIVSKVFALKVEAIINDVVKRQIFGCVKAWVYVIEEQKRGLPHMHALVNLEDDDKVRTPEDIDNIVSAEIPNRCNDPLLYEIILKHNIHGPCGRINSSSVCMVEGKCSKDFPKTFRNSTDLYTDGYPKYRRRDNSFEAHVVRGFPVDNSFVVPYNSYLSKRYNAHINVEICSSVKSVKYIYKYISKGHDCARIEMKQGMQDGIVVHDEIRHFLDCRYVTAPEAAWRIMEIPTHNQSHTVLQLAVHLENAQPLYYKEGHEEEALRRNSAKRSTLTAFFELNRIDEAARSLTYQEIPTQYHLDAHKRWIQRSERSHFGSKIIGRITSVSPRNSELYHLRMLLIYTKGATCFSDLRTVKGELCSSYREAAYKHGLINDDTEWKTCLNEGASFMLPCALRKLFVTILLHCNPLCPFDLWNDFQEPLCEDKISKYGYNVGIELALREIIQNLEAEGVNPADCGFQLPDNLSVETHNIDASNIASCMEVQLNSDQQTVYDFVLSNLSHNRQVLAFVDGPGGSGKTFLYTCLYYKLCSLGYKLLCVAWTGIAAILLPNGVTSHTAFGLPLDLNSVTVPRLPQFKKEILHEVDIIIWDEAPMCPGKALEMVDLLLKDIMNSALPFGGKTIILGGDFRQILPVIRGGSRGQAVSSTIKRCQLWSRFRTFYLATNVRASSDMSFSKWLLLLGEWKLEPLVGFPENTVEVPPAIISRNIVLDVFGQEISLANAKEIAHNVILCPKNEHVHDINRTVLGLLDGEDKVFDAIDFVRGCNGQTDDQAQANFPVEFLNTLNPNGFPQHQIHLKIGAIIMLLRNLSVKNGLCNGTRLIVRGIRQHVIFAEILTGSHSGELHLVPRITLNTENDPILPFNFYRHQFPVKLSYAMTINKSQGQTFEKVGIFLPTPCFNHGQLYVAFSRVRSLNALRVSIPNINAGAVVYTDNIVYKEVL